MRKIFTLLAAFLAIAGSAVWGQTTIDLSQKYEKERVKQYRFSAGFCGIASYTWNHLFRMPDMSEIWRLKQFSKNNIVPGLTNHVWLENKFDGSILDLSFDQSVDKNGSFIEIPYHLGNYVNSNFEFQRAYKFAKHIGTSSSGVGSVIS